MRPACIPGPSTHSVIGVTVFTSMDREKGTYTRGCRSKPSSWFSSCNESHTERVASVHLGTGRCTRRPVTCRGSRTVNRSFGKTAEIPHPAGPGRLGRLRSYGTVVGRIRSPRAAGQSRTGSLSRGFAPFSSHLCCPVHVESRGAGRPQRGHLARDQRRDEEFPRRGGAGRVRPHGLRVRSRRLRPRRRD